MRLFINLSTTDSIAALATAIMHKNIEIIPHHSKSVILQTDLGIIRSINAIVCFLLDADPLVEEFSTFLLWENSVLKPFIDQNLNLCIEKFNQIFMKLENKLQNLSKVSTPSIKSAVDVLIWADLLPIFKYPFSHFPVLRSHFKKVMCLNHCKIAMQMIEERTSNKLTKSVNKNSTKSSSSDTKQTVSCETKTVEESDESKILQELQMEITPLELIRTQSAFLKIQDASQMKLMSNNNIKLKRPAMKGLGIRNILVTSALPYVNNVPHLGNLIGSLLSANIFAIYCELAGYNCLSICGTDEYGTATETKAQTDGITPQELTDKYFKIHREVYQWFDIKFDYFGRTSTSKHIEITQEIFLSLYNKGYITEEFVDQLFCSKCSRSLADRFVEGSCPFCKFSEARGDQCDSCGRLINAIELVQPQCKICRTPPTVQSSKHLFLNLPKLQSKVNEFVHDRLSDPTANWTQIAKSISQSWLRDGLKPRCITRDLKWGVPVPLENFQNKVFYVWFDAPIGYLSITANYSPDWRLWWQPSEETAPIEYFQFMAKDNVPFHGSIFPACLLGVDAGYTIVKNLIATDYLNYEGKKFSKSRGIGVFGDNAKDTGIPSNIWRFYLAYIRPESQDSTFSWDDFAIKNNSELLNNLGNFINRPLTFLAKFFDSKIQNLTNLEFDDTTFLTRINIILRHYLTCMEGCHFRDGLRYILHISRLGNCYIQTQKPWVTVKSEETKNKASVATGIACNIAALIGILLKPFMPSVADEIFIQCNLPEHHRNLISIIENDGRVHLLLPCDHIIGEPKPLFKKMETEDVERFKQMYKC